MLQGLESNVIVKVTCRPSYKCERVGNRVLRSFRLGNQCHMGKVTLAYSDPSSGLPESLFVIQIQILAS